MSRLRRLQTAGRIFFVTCNLLPTRTLLTEADFALLAEAIVTVRARRGFLLSGYVFMPDHWHALIIPRQADTLPRIMNAVKVASMRRIDGRRGSRLPLWQARYYDHILRNVKEYHDTLRYMHLNPVEAGLAQQPQDWLWSSSSAYLGPDPVRLPVDLLSLPASEKAPL